VFREARALLERGESIAPPGDGERIDFYRQLLVANAEARGEKNGIEVCRRHLGLFGPALRARLRGPLCAARSLEESLAVLDRAAEAGTDAPAPLRTASRPSASPAMQPPG
jgi:hypothetical protein